MCICYNYNDERILIRVCVKVFFFGDELDYVLFCMFEILIIILYLLNCFFFIVIFISFYYCKYKISCLFGYFY